MIFCIGLLTIKRFFFLFYLHGNYSTNSIAQLLLINDRVHGWVSKFHFKILGIEISARSGTGLNFLSVLLIVLVRVFVLLYCIVLVG